MTCEYRIKRLYSGRASPTNSAIVPICIGNDVHEGAKQRVTLEWAVSKYRRVHVLIVDALQRHTIEILENMPPSEAAEVAIERGKEWVQRHASMLSSLGLSENLIYWGELLRSKDFPQYHRQVTSAYNKDVAFRQAVDLDVEAFTSRLLRRIPVLDGERLDRACRNYVFEELAAQHPVNVATSGVEVYPNVELFSAQAIRSGLVESIDPSFVAVGFVRMSYRRLRNTSNHLSSARTTLAA